MTLLQTDNLRLLQALRSGDSAAWQELCDKYLKLVFHIVRKTLATYDRLTTSEDVEDIAYDLFHSLVKNRYRALESLGPPYDIKAWLAISARRRSIDFVRKKQLATVSLDQSVDDRKTLGNLFTAPEEGFDVAGPRLAAVQQAMEVLNPKERMLLRLFYLKGKKYEQISKITGMNVNSIRPTLIRGIEKVQKQLRAEGVFRELSS